MKIKINAFKTSIILIACFVSIQWEANAALREMDESEVVTDSLTIEKLDSLLRPFVVEERAKINVKTKEEAHLVSEQLLVMAAASGLSDEKRPNEEVLASLIASLVSQRIKEEFNLVNDVYYMILFQDQAIYYSELGFHRRALEKELRAMSILQANKSVPEFEEYYPDELERLADRYQKVQNLPQAIDYQQQANDYYRSRSLLYYGCGLFKCARYYSEAGEYRKVIDCLNGFLSSMKKANEEVELEDMSELLALRGGAYLQIGDIKNSIKDYESNMTVSQILYGANSLEYSNSISNYATSLTFADRYYEAKEYFNQALSILDGNPEWGYDYMITCDQFSIVLIELGEYSEAKKYSDYAVDYCLRNKLRDYDYAQALINSSRCYSYLGDYERSYELSKEALQIEKDLGLPEERKNYGYYAALSSFANDALATGHLKEAEEACLVILNEGERTNFSAYIGSYRRLSEIEIAKGNFYAAMTYAQKAIDSSRKYSQSELSSLGQLAECYFYMAQYDKAVESYSQCVNIANKQFGDYNLSTLYYKICLCYSLFKANNEELVIRYVREINDNIKIIATKSLLGMTDKEKYFFIERISSWGEQILPLISASIGSKEIICELYNAILYNKGLLVLQERINNIAMHQDGLMCSQLKELRRRYNDKIEKGGGDSEESRTLLLNIESIEKDILNKLNNESINALIEMRNHSSWEEIKQTLSNKDLAVEMVAIKDSSQIYHYYALLLSFNSPQPKLIHLFKETDLPERPQIKGERPTKKELQYYDNYYERLYSLVWQPIEGELKGIKRIFFSPDRKLYAIGIEDATNNGKPLYETFDIKRVSSTIMLRKRPCKEKRPDQALIFGGLNMDTEISSENNHGTQTTTLDIPLPKFTDISQSTLEEVMQVKKLLDRKGIHSNTCTASEGTELQFKVLTEGHSVGIIHVATHGIFISDQSYSKYNKHLKDNPINGYSWYQNSMRHSGLALSGANHSSRCLEDNNGILTAKEISELFIPNQELTVLSACQTGQGDISFDGITGLQRGFKIAGSKTIIMSLWDVDSEVTTDLMSSFYQEWLKGVSKEEAFKKAKRKILKQHKNPYYWASFILLD